MQFLWRTPSFQSSSQVCLGTQWRLYREKAARKADQALSAGVGSLKTTFIITTDSRSNTKDRQQHSVISLLIKWTWGDVKSMLCAVNNTAALSREENSLKLPKRRKHCQYKPNLRIKKHCKTKTLLIYCHVGWFLRGVKKLNEFYK